MKTGYNKKRFRRENSRQGGRLRGRKQFREGNSRPGFRVRELEDSLRDILSLIEDVNPNEIASHIADGTLDDWCETWRETATRSVTNVRLPEIDLKDN